MQILEQQELIPVSLNENHEPVVSGRTLHEFLEVKTKYKDWFPRMAEYGFVENQDYTLLIFEHPQNKQEITDHALKLDMAKELSMIQRNEKGKQARRYFIQIEKAWNTPEQIMARALRIANDKINTLIAENAKEREHNLLLEQRVSEYEPKIQYLDTILDSKNSMTVKQIAADYCLSAQRLNQILHEKHIQYKIGNQWVLYKEHMGKGYTRSKTIPISKSWGTDSIVQTRWTQKGRLKIHNILESMDILANIDKD